MENLLRQRNELQVKIRELDDLATTGTEKISGRQALRGLSTVFLGGLYENLSQHKNLYHLSWQFKFGRTGTLSPALLATDSIRRKRFHDVPRK